MDADYQRIRAETRLEGWRARARFHQRWTGTPFAATEAATPRSGDILDVGCGFGVLSAWMRLRSPARRVWGVDADGRKIARARRWYGHLDGLTFVEGDLSDVPLPVADAAVIHDVLHHLRPSLQVALLQRLRARLKPGGVLVIKENDTSPAWKHVVSLLVEQVALRGHWTVSDPIHFRSVEEWALLLEKLGWRVERAEHLPAREGFFVPHCLLVAVNP